MVPGLMLHASAVTKKFFVEKTSLAAEEKAISTKNRSTI